MTITDEQVEVVAAKAFQKREGVKWADTSEGSRRKWRERYRAQMEAMARAEQKKASVDILPDGIVVTPSGKLVVEW